MSIRIDGTNTTANPGITGADADTGLQFGTDEVSIVTGGTEQVKVNSSGRLLVGTSTSRSVGGAAPADLQVEVSGSKRCASFVRNGGSPIFAIGTTGALGIGDTTLVSNGDILGQIEFAGADGTDLESKGATISALVDGTPGANDMPGRLVFSTTADGSASPTERMKIDRNGILYSVPTYNNSTGSTTNYMRIGADGQMYRSTSSIAYKTDVEDMGDTYADAILNLRPVWYRSTCEGDNPNHSHWGFIAEEVEQVDPRLCSFRDVEITYNEEGKQVVTPLDTPVVDGVDYAALTPLLLNLIKRQKEQIEAMEARLTALEGGAS